MLSTCVSFGARGRRSRWFNGKEVEVLTLRNPCRQLAEMNIKTRYANDMTSSPHYTSMVLSVNSVACSSADSPVRHMLQCHSTYPKTGRHQATYLRIWITGHLS